MLSSSYWFIISGLHTEKRRNACTSRLLASDGLPTNEQTLRPMAQQPIVGDHCFLLSEFRDALVKYVLQRYDIFSKKHIPWYLQRRFGSLVAEIRFQYGHFFRKKISSSFLINVDEPNLITVPHLGQRAGAFTTPPSIAMNS